MELTLMMKANYIELCLFTKFNEKSKQKYINQLYLSVKIII